MKLTKEPARPAPGRRRFVSKADAVLLMIVSAAAAVATTAMTIAGMIAGFTGPVTLALPVGRSPQRLTGLEMGASAHYTEIAATIPSVPVNEAALLAWSGALNQTCFLAVAGLLFLLALRLRGDILFTAGSGWIVGSCGVVLAAAGSAAQILDSAARDRLAELIGANPRVPDETVLFVANFTIAPALAGLVLVLVAGVFQFGRRLQKDTEGLI